MAAFTARCDPAVVRKLRHDRPADDLVIDATSLLDAVHEDLETIGDMRRQVYGRAFGHAHRMPARVVRKLAFLGTTIAALATAGIAPAANGGFTPPDAHSPNAGHVNTAYYVILGFTARFLPIAFART